MGVSVHQTNLITCLEQRQGQNPSMFISQKIYIEMLVSAIAMSGNSSNQKEHTLKRNVPVRRHYNMEAHSARLI